MIDYLRLLDEAVARSRKLAEEVEKNLPSHRVNLSLEEINEEEDSLERGSIQLNSICNFKNLSSIKKNYPNQEDSPVKSPPGIEFLLNKINQQIDSGLKNWRSSEKTLLYIQEINE